MKKFKYCTLLIVLCCFNLDIYSQSISQSSVSSGGSTFTVGGIQLSSTAGQAAFTTMQNGNIVMTQGQQQPYFLHLLNLKTFIEGYYMGSGQMAANLYNVDPVTYPVDYSDSITVELHESVSPYNIVSSEKTIIHNDGIASLNFSPGISGYYYIIIKHRNTLEVWSKHAKLFSNNSMSFDFATP